MAMHLLLSREMDMELIAFLLEEVIRVSVGKLKKKSKNNNGKRQQDRALKEIEGYNLKNFGNG